MRDAPRPSDATRLATALGFVAGIGLLFIILSRVFGPQIEALWTSSNREQIMLVTALLGVFGTFISAIVGVYLFSRQQRAREAEQAQAHQKELETTAQKEANYLKSVAAALRSEIRESLDRLAFQFTEDQILSQLVYVSRTIDEDPAHGMPAGVAMEENIIFDSHKEKVFEFPEELVRALVRYYQNDRYLNRYLHAMTQGDFDDLTPDRKKRAAVQYLDVGRTTYLAAIRARTMLDAYLVHFCKDDKDVHPNVTQARAKGAFDGFPTDQDIIDMLGAEDSAVFETELAKDAPNPAGEHRLERYASAAGIVSVTQSALDPS